MKRFEIVDTPWGLTAVDSADTGPVRLVYAIPEGQDAASAARLRVLVDQANAAEELLHQLCAALPFVEDAEPDACFKTDVVDKRIKEIRAAIAQAEALV